MSFVARWNPLKDLKMMHAKIDDPAQKPGNPIWFEQLKKEVDISASRASFSKALKWSRSQHPIGWGYEVTIRPRNHRA